MADIREVLKQAQAKLTPEQRAKIQADLEVSQAGNARLARRLQAEREQKQAESDAQMRRIAEERKKPSAEVQYASNYKKGSVQDKLQSTVRGK